MLIQSPFIEDDDELESVASLSSWESRPSSYESWIPYDIPDFPDTVVIDEWSIIGEGSHGQARRARIHRGERSAIVCIKLFNQDSRDAYIREKGAYTLMRHRGVRRCIPKVHFKGELPRWRWDGLERDDPMSRDREEILGGLVIEYFEDCRPLDLRFADLWLAEQVGRSLERIHQGGVVHNDIEERNILLVREAGKVRVVWIDFSSSRSGRRFDWERDIEWDEFRGFLLENMV